MAFSGVYNLWVVSGGRVFPIGAYTLDDEDTTLSGSEAFLVDGTEPFTYDGRVDGSTADFVATYDSGGQYLFAPDPNAYASGAFLPAYTDGAAVTLVCFAQGTRILTDRGEVAVEALRAGDLVATLADAGAPFAPVLWIGHRKVRLAGHKRAAEMAPIRIRAWFQNSATPLLRVEAPLAAHATQAMTPCAPMLLAGPELGALRDRLALRIAAPVASPAIAAAA